MSIILNSSEREAVLAIIDAEPELPGEMPDEIWNRLKTSKKDAEEVMRAAVRATKINLKARIL